MGFNKMLEVAVWSQLFLLILTVHQTSASELSTTSEPDIEDDDTSSQSSLTNMTLFPAYIVDERVQHIMRHLRANKSGIPGIEIPDPMEIPDFDSSVDQGMTSMKVHLTGVTISGMSAFTIDTIHTSLVKMELTLGLNFTQLNVNGNYSLDGKAFYTRVTGNGKFWMNIIRAYVSGWAKLSVTDNGQIQISQINLNIKVKDIQLHFENLLGGGFIASLVNKLINALSKVIFESIKPAILEELELTVQNTMNEQFLQLPPQPMLLTALSPLDVVIAVSAEQMQVKGLDPYSLPDHNEKFSHNLPLIHLRGSISLFDGYLKGLSSLHRSGDVAAEFSNNSITLTANLGFDMLEGGYKWSASLMGITKTGGLHFRIESVDLLVVISQANEFGSYPSVDTLKITDIQQIGLDVDGLGSLDFLLEFLTNFITNAFKKQLSSIVEGPVKNIIQENLVQMQLPF